MASLWGQDIYHCTENIYFCLASLSILNSTKKKSCFDPNKYMYLFHNSIFIEVCWDRWYFPSPVALLYYFYGQGLSHWVETHSLWMLQYPSHLGVKYLLFYFSLCFYLPAFLLLIEGHIVIGNCSCHFSSYVQERSDTVFSRKVIEQNDTGRFEIWAKHPSCGLKVFILSGCTGIFFLWKNREENR